jgi:hypothetical protein
MALRKQWRDLDRATVGRAPARYGVYELGDGEGNVVGVDWGVLRDELKEALAYGDGEQVRWTVAEHREHAENLAEQHRS